MGNHNLSGCTAYYIHPGGLFSDIGVMAAMVIMAIMAAWCTKFDTEYLRNRSEF